MANGQPSRVGTALSCPPKPHRYLADMGHGSHEMPNYREAREGNAYFCPVATYQRQPLLCLPKPSGGLEPFSRFAARFVPLLKRRFCWQIICTVLGGCPRGYELFTAMGINQGRTYERFEGVASPAQRDHLSGKAQRGHAVAKAFLGTHKD